MVEPGGLVVSKGSKAIAELNRFHRQNDLGDVSGKAESFEKYGRRFDCVAYAGDGYAPTLIWKLTPLVEPAQ